MPPLLQKLEGGDRRSIGQSEEVVSDVLKEPEFFYVLIEGLSVENPVIRMCASDAMEKVSLEYLDIFDAIQAITIRTFGHF